MDTNYCKYCDKYFHFKDLYDQHIITCEYFYRSRRQRDRESDVIETLPSPQEQFKLIQHMALQINKLEHEVIKLKINAGTRRRKIILEILNNPNYPKPPILFDAWYKSFQIEDRFLESVFNYDLVNGMKVMFQFYLALPNIPICAFKQKMNSIYVWRQINELEAKWVSMDNDLYNKWIRYMSHLFLQKFMKWQLQNSELIHSCDEEKEKNISNMQKINGLGDNYEQKRKTELRKKVYDLLATDIQINEHIYV